MVCESRTDDLTAPPAALEVMGAESLADVLMLRARGLLKGGREERWGVLQGVNCPTGTEEGQGQRVKGR